MISLAGRGLAEGASRAASRAALYFGLAIMMTAGLAFLLVAASIAIAGLYGVVIGWLFAGSVLIVIALLGFLLMASRRRRVLVRQAPVRPVSDVDLALGLMPGLMRTSPWVVLAVCAAGAFFTARRVHGDKTQTDRR
jgi:small-conductance mechanosensitive channel